MTIIEKVRFKTPIQIYSFQSSKISPINLHFRFLTIPSSAITIPKISPISFARPSIAVMTAEIPVQVVPLVSVSISVRLSFKLV